MPDAPKPRRIQRQRTRGWQMPALAKYVGRPTIFGNPFPVDIYGREKAVDLFRRWLNGNMSADEMSQLSFDSRYSSLVTARIVLRDGLPELKGKTLCCWCKPDSHPCHADVLLELANV